MFKTLLWVEKIGPNAWRLLKPLVYEGSEKYIVPADFKTDFASVPRIAWWFCPPAAGNHAEAAVLHDYLCVTSSNQKHTDKIFLEAMKANGVGWLKRTVMYMFVRVYQTAKCVYLSFAFKQECLLLWPEKEGQKSGRIWGALGTPFFTKNREIKKNGFSKKT